MVYSHMSFSIKSTCPIVQDTSYSLFSFPVFDYQEEMWEEFEEENEAQTSEETDLTL